MLPTLLTLQGGEEEVRQMKQEGNDSYPQAHYPPENADNAFKESTQWSVTQFQVSINVYTWMCLAEVNDSSFSSCSPCWCLLSIRFFIFSLIEATGCIFNSCLIKVAFVSK